MPAVYFFGIWQILPEYAMRPAVGCAAEGDSNKENLTMRYWMPVSALLAFVLPALAHMDQATLKPAGGETFKPGDVMVIEWMATQAHDGKYDIYYSSNGGTSWPTEFAEAWQGPTTNNTKVTYRWTIPANTANTTQGRIRVCQLAGGHCTQPGTYTISSTNFTISNATGVRDAAAQASAPSLDYRADSRTVDLVVPLQAGMLVTLKAYDAAGKEVADLYSQRLEAGVHRLSLFATRLQDRGPLLFRLTRGAEETVFK